MDVPCVGETAVHLKTPAVCCQMSVQEDTSTKDVRARATARWLVKQSMIRRYYLRRGSLQNGVPPSKRSIAILLLLLLMVELSV